MPQLTKPHNGSVRCCALAPVRTETQPPLRPIAERSAEDPAALNVRLLEVLSNLDRNIQRIADRLDPAPPDIVGTPYVAQKLGCTTTWIADQIRSGEIPRACVVPGTGNGKPWKFHRAQIDRWIESR